MLCGVALFALLRSCGLYLFRDDQQYEATSHGIGVGQWMCSIGLPRLGALITLRIVGRLLRLFAWPMAAPVTVHTPCLFPPALWQRVDSSRKRVLVARGCERLPPCRRCLAFRRGVIGYPRG